MFIKLPSGLIIRIDSIFNVLWSVSGESLMVSSNGDIRSPSFLLSKEDGKYLYDYLDSISIQQVK